MSRLRIFDFDGTLVDSYMPVAELDTRILSPIGTLEMTTKYGGATLKDKNPDGLHKRSHKTQ